MAAAVDVAGEEARRKQLALAIQAAATRVRELEDGRRHPMSPPEIDEHERRITYKRRELEALQTEFGQLVAAADARAEARRAAAAAAAEAARPGLEKRRAELEQAQQVALVAVEKHLAALAETVEAALASSPELESIARQLEEPRGYVRPFLIASRIKAVLCRLGPLSDLDPVLGRYAYEPLVEAPAQAPARTAASSRKRQKLPAEGDGLPRSSTGRKPRKRSTAKT